MVFWTLRLCIPFGVRPCMHTATSSWTFGSHPHSHSVEHPVEHLHPLLFSLFRLSCFVTLGCTVKLFVFACCWLCSCFMGSRVPTPGSFTFFTPFGACIIQPNPMISMPTSPSESLLLFNPWNQLNFYVTGFKNTQASRDNRSCHFHAQLCRGTEFAAPALSRASSRRLNDAFNVMSFLRGSDFSRLFLHTTIVCV